MRTNKDKSRIAAFLAALLTVTAFLLYNWRILAGETHPNISSWGVWAFVTVLNFTSYKKLTGDWVKSILPTVNSGLCIVTALLSLRSGSLRDLGASDQICFALGVIAGIYWWISKSAVIAQILLQIAIVIGFVPTLVGAWHNPSSEPWLSWFLWSAAFVSQTCAVKFTWRGKYMDFLYPVNMILFHVAVFVLAVLPKS